MAKQEVIEYDMPIKWACDAFRISETCDRYEAKLRTENDEIADWLIRLTDNNRNWGFGLCFLYLRNIKNGEYVSAEVTAWSERWGIRLELI